MERAARFCGTAARLRERASASLWPSERAAHERTVATAGAVLGDAAFEAEADAGGALSLEQAIAAALDLDGQGDAPRHAPEPLNWRAPAHGPTSRDQ